MGGRSAESIVLWDCRCGCVHFQANLWVAQMEKIFCCETWPRWSLSHNLESTDLGMYSVWIAGERFLFTWTEQSLDAVHIFGSALVRAGLPRPNTEPRCKPSRAATLSPASSALRATWLAAFVGPGCRVSRILRADLEDTVYIVHGSG